ncbi:BTAD domain-containing putative transcriptional regulator [Nonomuraea sp. NPDC026600]|uniref:BTAD domain-containing putative transcriptional regulator n=1 Tax=Nonomuraea sp. NPDC026600 TaxID=3155363 RepID=UPI0033FB6F3B
MTAVRFSVLGPLRVERDGRTISVPGGKVRTLLATLLLRPNQIVPLDLLTERLWGHRPPKQPLRALRTDLARLRRSLDLGPLILTEPGGYVARLRPEQLDLLEFQELVRAADQAKAATLKSRLLRDALRLWRGPVCADVESEAFHRIDVPPLAEQRLHVLERRIDLDAQLGKAAELTVELRALTAEHPLRERFWAQLMTALCRSGRQAEALETYRTVSRLLKEELGIGPNAELRRLHQAMLTGHYQNEEHPGASRAGAGRQGREDPAEPAEPAEPSEPSAAQEPRREQGNLPEDAPAFGALLRAWRKRARLTQEQLAERAGLNARTVRRWERGAAPRDSSVQLLAEALELDGAEQAVLARAADALAAETAQVVPDKDHERPAPPRQLPADVPVFVGRAGDLAALSAEAETTAVVIIAVCWPTAGCWSCWTTRSARPRYDRCCPAARGATC